ncbi:MAG TPA: glucose-6-phosphate dehydrogenase assembly protein OpcA [Bryobacteraceae bacterium]|nr:glucose-6-phosphate dehydrogenase assembly protein OpcA [Bryobacteraceae bacterium]
MPAAVQPERILKDLAKLWIDLAKPDTEKNASGVIRACAMTLIVGLEQREDTQEVGLTIAELIHEHPSRAIVLRVDPSDGGTLDARVFAQCWMPFGKRQQICCEEIEISTPVSRLADVPKLMLALTVPDLPVVLWARSPRLALDSEFQQLFTLATKIIIDSARFDDQEAAYRFVKSSNDAGRNVIDLAWTRLTPLRQLVAQAFENSGQVRRVVLSYSGTGARYLETWFRKAVPQAEVITTQENQVRVVLEGAAGSVSITLEDATSATVTMNDMSRRVALPERNEQSLLREELSIVGPDPIFRRILE